jgi:endonuclease/exonuclease/phosphatase family metal-dependent hydrolase
MQDEQEFQWWERRERLARVISEDVQPQVVGLQEVRIAESVQGTEFVCFIVLTNVPIMTGEGLASA